MDVIIFEDRAVERLGLLTAARPACDLLIGATTLTEALARFGPVRRLLRPQLARHVAALAGRRTAVWGSEFLELPPSPAASTHGSLVLLVNARVAPSRENIGLLRSLVESGRRGLVPSASGVAAAILHAPAAPLAIDAGSIESLLADQPSPERLDAAIEMVALPHEVLSAHERAIEGALAMQIDTGRFRELRGGLFVAAGAQVADGVVVRQGPVVVDADAEIGPFVCLDGPIWIGRGTHVNPHAWIRAGTAVGRHCRVGGELEATVLEPFSNKAHGGFVGHSHVGSWVNIAAGTITSNLKATYGPVRLHDIRPDGSRETTHTDRQFMGALVGDFARTGINASIPCGARIGVASTVGGTVPEQVAAFTNLLVGGPPGTRTTAEQAAIVLGRMMDRRGLALAEADRDLLESLSAMAAEGGQPAISPG
jgi:glucose-1-phosphate thymidylyltransferase